MLVSPLVWPLPLPTVFHLLCGPQSQGYGHLSSASALGPELQHSTFLLSAPAVGSSHLLLDLSIVCGIFIEFCYILNF
jgi:hypothetical protein